MDNFSDRNDTAKFPARTKCEFCDVTFRCDMDVSRHLKSDGHQRKVSEFMSLRNDQDKVVEKQIPKNFEQLLKRLKVRNVKDLDELVDKGYFNLSDEKLVQILIEISRRLSLAIRDHATKDLPPAVRSIFTTRAQTQNQTSNRSQTPNQTQAQVETQTQSRAQSEPDQPQAGAQVQPKPEPSESPSSSTNLQTPNQSPQPPQQPRPSQPSQPPRPPQPSTKSTDKRQVEPPAATLRKQAVSQAEKVVSSKNIPTPARPATKQPAINHPATDQPATKRLSSTQPTTSRPTSSLPTTSQSASVRTTASRPTSSGTTTTQSRPKASGSATTSKAPPSNQNPPPTTATGASKPLGMPDPNCTYVPKLAIIKVEPKD